MKNKTILSVILISFYAVIVVAQIDRSKPPAPGPAPTIKIGDYESFELENGLKVFVIENHKIPRVTYTMIFDYDPVLEGENAGYIAITGSLIGTGTKTRTKAEIDEAIDFIGAQFYTTATSFYAAALKKHNEDLLDVVSDVVLHSEFTQEELEKIRKKALSGLAFGKNDPKTIARRVSSVMYYGKDHPYGELETEQSIKNVTLDMCTNHYKTYYRPNIAYLAIVGDITVEEAKPLIEKYFGEWEKGEVPSETVEFPDVPQKIKVVVVDRPGAVQSVISVGYPIDLKVGSNESIKASVMNTVLGGGAYRLFINLRETHGYTYGAYSRIHSDKYVGYFSAFADVRNEVTDSAITEILYEMNRIVNEPVPEDECSRVKNNMAGRFALSLEDPKTIGRFALNIQRYKLPDDYYADYLKKLESVSAEDIQTMAKEYIRPDNAYIIVVGEAEEIAEKLKKLSPDREILYYDADGNAYDPNQKIVPEGIEAKTVLENYMEAIGGKDKIEKMESELTTARMIMQGMPIDVKIINKKPDKFCMEMSMNGNIVHKVVYNEGQVLVTGMQGTQTEFDEEKMEDFTIQKEMCQEQYFLKNNYEIELLPSEMVNGKEAYVVEITKQTGTKMKYYYDIETGLRVKTLSTFVSEMGSMEQELLFLNYVEKEGLVYPSIIRQTNAMQSFDMEIVDYSVNTEINEEKFVIDKP